MNMDARTTSDTAAALAQVLREEGLQELTLETPSGSFRLRRRRPVPASPPAPEPAEPIAFEGEETIELSPEELEGAAAVTSTVVGVVRLSRAVGEPLVAAGDDVLEGQLLGFIESMTINQEVRAPATGRVMEVLVHDGDPVEYGQALMILDTAS